MITKLSTLRQTRFLVDISPICRSYMKNELYSAAHEMSIHNLANLLKKGQAGQSMLDNLKRTKNLRLLIINWILPDLRNRKV